MMIAFSSSLLRERGKRERGVSETEKSRLVVEIYARVGLCFRFVENACSGRLINSTMTVNWSRLFLSLG